MIKLSRRLLQRVLQRWYLTRFHKPTPDKMRDADAAVRRSDAAIKEVRWSEAQVQPAIDYLRESAAQNHYRLKVESAWRRRST